MKFRHEIKHQINTADYYSIMGRLKHVIGRDLNAGDEGEYKIRSIYFDNCYDKVLTEKALGLNNREKFRIRFYNDDTSLIKLEKKSKINGLCLKVDEPISKEECEMIQRGDIEFLKESSKKLFNELYVKMKNQLLRPKTIVDYMREAYVYKPGNVRITFDKKIETGIWNTDFLSGDVVTKSVISNDYMVLEVKWDEYLPEVIQACVQQGRLKSSISKYALCRMYD